jgi:hypothetical protein
MRRPQNLPHRDLERLDCREDLVRTLALVRLAVGERSRREVETACRALLRRLARAEMPLDDRAEMTAVVELLIDRVKYGLTDRLRKLLLPLVAAVESQMELCSD